MEKGVGAIPLLEEASENAPSGLRARIRLIVDELATMQVSRQFEELVRTSGEDIDLEAGILLIARYGYPNQDLRWCTKTLDQLSHELDSKLDVRYDPGEIISAIATFFGQDKGFSGNTEDYYDADNSYINRVLQRRSGLPISLCSLYLLVARRLNIPLFGVGMPGHFLLKYQVGENEIFLDPFRGGKLLSRTDCREFLEVIGLGFRDEYLQTVSNRQIIERMIRNLIVAYRHRGEMYRLPSLQGLLSLLGSDQHG